MTGTPHRLLMLVAALLLVAAACTDSNATDTAATDDAATIESDQSEANSQPDEDDEPPLTEDTDDGDTEQSDADDSTESDGPGSDNSDSDEAESDSDGADSDETTSGLADSTTEVVNVVLIDAGAEPRSELRLAPQAGQVETQTQTQTQEITQTIDGVDLPAQSFSTVTETEITIEAINDNTIDVLSVVTSSASGEGDPAVDDALQSVVGLTTRATVDGQGRTLSTEIQGLDQLDAATASLVSQLSEGSQLAAPLPAEPVGVGASWRIDQIILFSGIEVGQQLTYTLVSIDGTMLELDVEVTQSVPAGTELDLQGVAAEVALWEATGGGSLSWDLGSVVPNGAISLDAQQDLQVTLGANTQLIEQVVSSESITAGN